MRCRAPLVGAPWSHPRVPRTERPPPGPAALAPGLVRRARLPVEEPEWDGPALRVLAHAQGPLRVLGGPGTGKTTVLLAAVAAAPRAGEDPTRTLVLVGSRRAAAELRERLGELVHGEDGPAERTSREPLVRTVHSYAFGVLRLHAARNGDPPPRLLASAEQDAVVRDLLAGEVEPAVPHSGWPERLLPAIAAAGVRRRAARAAAARGRARPRARGAGRAGRDSSTSPSGGPRAGSSARTSRSRCCAGPRAGARRRPPRPRSTPPSWWPRRWTRWPPIPSCWPPSGSGCATSSSTTRRTSIRSRWSWSGCSAPPPPPCCSPAIPTRPCSPSAAPIPRACGRWTRPPSCWAPTTAAGAAVRAACARLAARLPGAGEGRLRMPPPHLDVPDGAVAVRVFTSPAQEAGWVADQLRRAHLVGGVPWSEMAVLARSTRRSLPTLRRALLAAGVPIAAPPDELPLARQPAVVPLLMVLRFAARPQELDADAATALLTSPLGSADPMRMRRLRRGLLRLHAGLGRGRHRAGPRDGGRRAAGRPIRCWWRPCARRRPGRPDPLAALPPRRHRAAAPGRRPARHRRRRRPRRGEPRGGALAGLAGRAGSRSAGATRAPAAGRSAPPPTAISTPCSPCSTPPPGTPTGCPAPDSPASPSTSPTSSCPATTLAAGRPAGRGRRAAHRARRARPGVDRRRRARACRRAPGPTCGCAAACWATSGSSTSSPGSPIPTPAVSRVAPLLAEERRLFYVACTRARHTLLVSGVPGGGRAALPVPRRARPAPGRAGRAGGAPARAARWCWPSWSASCAGPSATRSTAAGAAAPSGRRAGPARRRRRARRAPRRLVRASRRCRAPRRCARPASRHARCRRPTSR